MAALGSEEEQPAMALAPTEGGAARLRLTTLLVVLELELGPAVVDLRAHDSVELMDGDDGGVLGGERRRCARKIWRVSRMRAGSCVREYARRRRPTARR
jgi:hypothetical protein